MAPQAPHALMGENPDDRLLTVGYALLTAAAFFGFAISSFLPVAVGMESRPFSVAYRAMVILGSLIFVWRAAHMRRAILPSQFLWPVALLAVMLVLRMVWDSLVTPLPMDLTWDDFWLETIAISVIPTLPYVYLPSSGALRMARMMCIAAGIVAVVSIAAGAYLSVRSFTSGSRLTTDVLHPIGIGEVGVSLFVVSLASFGDTWKISSKFIVMLARAGSAAMGVVLCIVAASKGPLLSLAAVSLVMFVQRQFVLSRGRRVVEIAFAAVAATGLAIAAIFLAKHGLLTIYDRFSDITSDRSTALRVQAWFGALSQYDSSPLLGDNFIELSTRFYPHNTVLETMMAVGVFGLLLLLLILALSSAAALGLFIQAHDLSWVGLLFLQHAMSGMLSGSIYRTGGYWISILMVVGAFMTLRRVNTQAMPGALPSAP